MSDTIDHPDVAGLLKLSDGGNPGYKTLSSNYPRASIYEEMKQKNTLNR